MFDLPSLRIGRVFGIPIEVNPTWLLIFGLVAFSLASGYFPQIKEAQGSPAWLYGLVGVVSALLFFASVVLHELGHSLVARAGGLPVRGITLFMLGGVSQLEDEPATAGKEFVMAFAGPLVSFAIAIISYALAFALQLQGVPWWIWAPLGYLGLVNLLVGVFNLLPGFPLDGGRVLRSIMWAFTGDLLKATRWAAMIGQVIGWLMVAGAVYGVAVGHTFDFIWFGLIGWFIASMASAAYRQLLVKTQLATVTIDSAMTHSPVHVDAALTLEELAHDYFLGGRHSRYPVMSNGEIIGLISLAMVKDVPREKWATVTVADVADKDLANLTVDGDAHVDTTLPRFAEDRPGALLVVEHGRMVGILTRSDVIELLRRVRQVA